MDRHRRYTRRTEIYGHQGRKTVILDMYIHKKCRKRTIQGFKDKKTDGKRLETKRV